MSSRCYEIRFIIKDAGSPTQKTVIHSGSPGSARRIFEQQSPGCRISSTPSEVTTLIQSGRYRG